MCIFSVWLGHAGLHVDYSAADVKRHRQRTFVNVHDWEWMQNEGEKHTSVGMRGRMREFRLTASFLRRLTLTEWHPQASMLQRPRLGRLTVLTSPWLTFEFSPR